MPCSWPNRFKGGRTIDTPVISLDILPTVLDAMGQLRTTTNRFDGKSLLPLMTGETQEHHETLFWSKGSEGQWAVRRGDWKLHSDRGRTDLIHLAKDPAETKNLADRHPEIVEQLTVAYQKWIEPMPNPITGGSKHWGGDPNGDSNRERRRLRNRRQPRRGRAIQRRNRDTSRPDGSR